MVPAVCCVREKREVCGYYFFWGGRESEDVGIYGTVKQCCVVTKLHPAYSEHGCNEICLYCDSVGPVMPVNAQGTNNDSFLAE